MKLLWVALCFVSGPLCAFDFDQFIDELDNNLVFTAPDYDLRARLSGRLDSEFFHFNQPAPGLIDSASDNVFNPRLSLFLDAQAGSTLYFFTQTRIDRGFDPNDHGAQIRMDEYALRLTPWQDGRFNLQVGKFATVIGNWVPRHLSWENPFVNAPLIYENVTAISDKSAPVSPRDFVQRFDGGKYDFNPVIWGPDYASGIAVSGRLRPFDYAIEVKNSAPSSHPASWNITTNGFDRPEFDGRVGYRPDETWTFGVSAADGPYFRAEAERTLPRGRDLDDYRELLLGQDASFAWHHLQLWAEFYEARFEVPRVGNADTFAYYLEGKYKFTPQFFGALRWNQQLFDTISAGGGKSLRWGADLGRVDVAAGYRFTAHTQLKLQYSFEQQTSGPGNNNHLFAAQFTVRF